MSYIGPYEIDTLTDKTDDYFVASFKPVKRQDTGAEVDVPPMLFSSAIKDNLITEEPMDLTFIRSQIATPAVAEMLATLVKYAVSLEDMQFVVKTLNDSLGHSIKEADKNKWGNYEQQRTIAEIHLYLMESTEQ